MHFTMPMAYFIMISECDQTFTLPALPPKGQWRNPFCRVMSEHRGQRPQCTVHLPDVCWSVQTNSSAGVKCWLKTVAMLIWFMPLLMWHLNDALLKPQWNCNQPTQEQKVTFSLNQFIEMSLNLWLNVLWETVEPVGSYGSHVLFHDDFFSDWTGTAI